MKRDAVCARHVRSCAFRCTFSDGEMRCDERVCKKVRPISYGRTAMSRSLIQVSRPKGCVAISRIAGCGADNTADANPNGRMGATFDRVKKLGVRLPGVGRG